MRPRLPTAGAKRVPASLLCLLIALTLPGPRVGAATFVVSNTNQSGAGSLPQAILDANASPGADLIHFNILSAGLNIAPSNALPAITEAVTIDGTTQPGFAGTPLVELSGQSAGAGVDGFRVQSGNSVIRGLIINRFTGDGIELTNGGNNVIAGNWIGLNTNGTADLGNTLNGITITNSAGNTIGGLVAADRNVIAGNNQNGVFIRGLLSAGNTVRGNYLGLNAAGAAAVANSQNGVFLDHAPSNTVGGTTAAARNVISGNSQSGVRIENTNAYANLIAGNYLGTSTNGLTDLGNGTYGVLLLNSRSNSVGGATTGHRNVISGNNNAGVRLEGANATTNAVRGNLIGTTVTGTSGLANGGAGVHVLTSAVGNTIGGASAGEANVIAFNTGDGVWVQGGTNNASRANLIHSNGGLGIDVDLDGVLANDAGDADTGANQRQNHPLLTGATNAAGGITIAGTLNSAASQAFTLDFFASSVPDGTGSGEGEYYLGNSVANTAVDGNASFQVTLPVVALGRWITATATDAQGNTSEFSPAIRAQSTLAPATFTVVNTNDVGAGSLRQAILDSNLAVSSTNNVIQFAIPNAGPHAIRPASALPTLIEAATVNGFTQSGAVSNNLASGNNAVWMIHLDGVSAGTGANGLRFASSSNVVRGLQIFRFNSDGLEFTNSHNNLVVGNSLGRLDEAGVTAGNTGDGVHLLQSSGNRIGGALPGDRNILSGNGSDGLEINGTNSVNNLVLGNYVGTDGAGTVDRGNGQNGVIINGAPNNTIGGTGAGAGNLLSGNGQEGLEINGLAATNNVVLGNRIGTEVTGLAGLGNSAAGILLANNARFNQVGGTAPGAGNRIAFNTGDGINVANGTNNALRANLIWTNNALGIDLDPNGITLNDAGDADTGGNQLQNFPVITNALLSAGSTVIQGALHSTAGTTFELDFFQSAFRDVVTTNGEGQFYLGSVNVATDGSGNATFDVNLPVTAGGGRWITATATDPNGNSSEFSTALAATSLLPGQTFLVTNTNDSGPGSLRQAILDNNVTFNGAPNTINFAIPGVGPHPINPATVLPTVTAPVIINGYSQAGAAVNSLATGNNAVLKVHLDGNGAVFNGLRVAAAGSVVKGLSFTRFNNPLLQLDVPGFVTVEGCFFGLAPDGVTSFGASSEGVNVNNSPGNVIGGGTPAQRNVFGGLSTAIALASNGAVSNLVAGNYIGTDRHGTGGTGNQRGLTINGGRTNTIGGTTAALRNVISSNRFFGLQIIGAGAAGNRVLGNYVGLNAAGTGPLGNGTHGIDINSATTFGNVIGGIGAGAANVIAHSGQNGINVSSGTNNTLRGNAIYSSGDLAIDLGGFGLVSLNDAGDTDTGANQLQNFPVITGGQGTLVGTTIQGTLNSKPSETFQLDFYSNPAAEADGYGEGRKYLGSGSTTTGADGNAVFAINVAGVMEGRHVTATATDAHGNTSEFSQSVPLAVTFAPSTFTVVNTNDAGPGSLRQAILDSNLKPSSSRNTIAFNIPGAGPHAIRPLTPLPTLVESALIDGYTQPGATANTAANGFNAVLKIVLEPGTPFSDGLTLDYQNSVVRGLIFNNFGAALTVRGTGHTIEGCVFGLTPTGLPAPNAPAIDGQPGSSNNVVGGVTTAARNVISRNQSAGAITLNNGTGWQIQGNFIGTDFSGLNAEGNQSAGIYVAGGAGNVIGGTTSGAGNVIGGNGADGVQIYGGSGHLVAGNLIGVGVDGVTPLRNFLAGVSLQSSALNIVGGNTAAARNIISGNGTGVTIQFAGTLSNYVTGNFIGTDLTGTVPVPNSTGVAISGDTNFVGGVLTGEGNRIAFNQSTGIYVGGGTGNALRGNEVFGNGGIGIGLEFSVVTPNDPGDPDIGANTLQNFPVLASGTVNVASTAVGGALNSTPNTQFTLDFYANTAPDPSGNGEGQQYVGTTTATTDVNGNAVFSTSLPRRAAGRYLTATATDPAGNTSGFSAAFRAASTQPALTFTVTTDADSGPGSLRQAMLNSETNQAGANNLIQFAIPGPGPHTIAPLTALPFLKEAVTIDGFTQSGASANTLAAADNAVRMIRLDGTFNNDGLKLLAGGSLVRGLEFRNHTGPAAVEINSNGNAVEGCRFVDGVVAIGILSGAGNRIGGTTPGQRNLIAGNSSIAVYVNSPLSSGTLVQGNFIGLNADGLTTSPNLVGVHLDDTPLNVVGGSEAARNFIVGNAGQGVLISGAGSVSNRVEGNFIGVRPDGAAAGNEGHGVHVTGGSGTIIGAPRATPPGQFSIQGMPPATGVMNAIAYNQGNGIEVLGGFDNALRRNLIYFNRDLGIDLDGDGVTDNDVLDADPGSNNLQNFPVITSASIGSGTVTVNGSLQGRPNTSYQIDVYSNVNCDSPTRHGEGQYWRGSFHITTDGAGNGSIINQTVNQPGMGTFITATATDPAGNTSEFGECVTGQCGDTTPKVLVVLNANASGPGSLPAVIDQANADCSPKIISFNLPGGGPHRIFPTSSLVLAVPTTINFTTQPGWTANNRNVILDGGLLGMQPVFEVFSDDVSVQGFTIQNAIAGILAGGPNVAVADLDLHGRLENIPGPVGAELHSNNSVVDLAGSGFAGDALLIAGTGNVFNGGPFANVGGDVVATAGDGTLNANFTSVQDLYGELLNRGFAAGVNPPNAFSTGCSGLFNDYGVNGNTIPNSTVRVTLYVVNQNNPTTATFHQVANVMTDSGGTYSIDIPVNLPPNAIGVRAQATVNGDSSELGFFAPAANCAPPSLFTLLPDENNRFNGVVGDPISTFNGELYDALPPDLNLGGPMPLLFQRFYGSALGRATLLPRLGTNWTHNFEATLTNSATVVGISLPPGMLLAFTNQAGVFSLINRADLPFQLRSSAGNYLLADPRDQRVYTFSSAGQLTQIADSHGNAHTLAYSGPLLSSVTDGLGRTLTFSYSAGGSLTNVSDGARNAGFQQSDNMLVVARTPLNLPTTNTYTVSGPFDALLQSSQRPAGNAPLTQFYAGSAVASQSVAGNPPSTLQFVGSATSITDPLGFQTQDQHSTNGLLVRHTDAGGRDILLGYDSAGRRTNVTDRLGRSTGIGYHAASGNVAAITNADGSVLRYDYASRTFNALTLHDVRQITLPDGRTEQFLHDASGNAVGYTNRGGFVTRISYNARGQVLTATNPAGGVVTYTYDAAGRLLTSRDSETGNTTYGYDQFSRLTNIAHPDGATLRFTWDADDRLTSATDERGHTRAFGYDSNGRLTTSLDPLGAVSRFAYDLADRLIGTTNRLGDSVTRSINGRGELIQVENEPLQETQFTYDGRGRLVTLRDGGSQNWNFSYDDEDRLMSFENPLGERLTFARDVLGAVVGTTNPLGHAEQFQLDVMRRPTNRIDAVGRQFQYAYDARGLLTNVVHPGVGAAAYQRDALGNLTRITDLNGRPWSFAYSPMGRLLSVADPLNRTNRFTYDQRGRPATTAFADNSTVTNTYDPAGNLTRRQYSAGPDLPFTYDALGRLTSAEGLAFAYDAEGRLTNTASGGVNFGTTYDRAGRITGITYSNDAFSVIYQHDGRGLLNYAQAGNSFGTVSYQRDGAGRVTNLNRGNGVNATYTYDAAGRLVRIRDGSVLDLNYTLNAGGEVAALDAVAPALPSDFAFSNTNNFTYDNAHQVTTAGYAYDARGRRTAMPGKAIAYDGASRVIANGGVTYTYNGLGQVATRTENGVTRRYYYHHALPGAPLLMERDDAPGTTLRFYVWSTAGELLWLIDGANGDATTYYHFDRTGHTLALTDQGGAVTDAYAWTPTGELVKRTGTSAQPFTYVGRWGVRADNGLFHMRARWYDPRTAAFLTRDPIWPRLTAALELNPYDYAADQPLEFIDPEGLNSLSTRAEIDRLAADARNSNSWDWNMDRQAIYHALEGRAQANPEIRNTQDWREVNMWMDEALEKYFGPRPGHSRLPIVNRTVPISTGLNGGGIGALPSGARTTPANGFLEQIFVSPRPLYHFSRPFSQPGGIGFALLPTMVTVNRTATAPPVDSFNRPQGSAFWARPELRAFVAAAIWNNAPADGTPLSVPSSGPDNTFGLLSGVQAENWW